MEQMIGVMEYDDFQKQETSGMRRKYDTYCAGPTGLIGKVVITVVGMFGGIGQLYHVDSVDYQGIHLKNGNVTHICPIDHYWRFIVLYD